MPTLQTRTTAEYHTRQTVATNSDNAMVLVVHSFRPEGLGGLSRLAKLMLDKKAII